MLLTDIARIEAAAHREFSEGRPSKADLNRFVTQHLPKMDGGVSIAIAAAALLFQMWSLYRDEMDRKDKARAASVGATGSKSCPKCGRPSNGKTKVGKFKCAKGHTW